jgi:hypothetical protein
VSPQTRIVLSTLCVFNAIILGVLGVGCVAYVDGPLRFPLAAAMWLAAATLVSLSHRLRRGVDWH